MSNRSEGAQDLILGSIVSQGITILLTPILTRLYSPTVFGEAAVFSALTGIVGVVACLRYEPGIVATNSDEEAVIILRICCFFSTVISFLVFIIFSVFRKRIFEVLQVTTLSPLWYLIPVFILLTGLFSAFGFWFTRFKNYKYISLSKIFQSVLMSALAVLFAFAFNANLLNRLLSMVLGVLFSFLYLVTKMGVGEKGKYIYKKIPLIKYGKVIRKYSNYYYDAGASFINAVSWQIVPMMMTVYYSSNDAGQYSLGLRMIQLPISIIGTSIGQVFFQVAARKTENGGLFEYTKSTIIRLAKYSSIPAITIGIFAPQMFTFVFGREWQVAGVYTQILVPWALVWFLISPLGNLYTLLNKQKIYLSFQIVNLLSRWGSIYLGSVFDNKITGMILFSFSGFLVYSIMLIYIIFVSKKIDRNKNIYANK